MLFFLKKIDDDIESVIEKIHDLRANILYMLSLEKVIGEEQESD